MKLALLAFSFLPGLASAAGLAVDDAWIRSGPPGAPLAGYATFANGDAEALRIVGATSPAFERVELHEMRMADGVMQMRKLDFFEVPAGAAVAFEPGADHLMLHGARSPLAPGDEVSIEFVDAAGRRTTVPFEVRPAR
jgi:copper(I)-binding protein